jgi:hypothetical protein
MNAVCRNILLVLCVFASGCASTHYSTFEGGRIIEGTGGTKKTVEGIDIWKLGTPPRKFRIIGIIDDKRRQSLIGMASYESTIVKKAKEAGGDGVIFLDSRKEIVGYYNPGTSGTARTTGTANSYGGNTQYQSTTTYQTRGSTSTAMVDKISTIAVIEYVD